MSLSRRMVSQIVERAWKAEEALKFVDGLSLGRLLSRGCAQAVA